jgi:Epoxide hydrolase N terminus
MTQAADKNAIRPFHVNVPEAELTELRRRINATKWPERETVTDDSQGVPLAMMQALALLGNRLRLAHVRGETERAPAIHDRDRWARHSFHSRAFEA